MKNSGYFWCFFDRLGNTTPVITAGTGNVTNPMPGIWASSWVARLVALPFASKIGSLRFNAPRKSRYNFQKDVCIEVENGDFTEFPISSLRYSPLFFWKLYILGRLFPAKHKMMGDGKFLSQGGRKRSVLTTYTDYHVSNDGYYASKLSSGLQKSINLKFNEMVVIGHPKGNTSYSLSKLKNFIELNQNNHCFITFPDKWIL